MRNGAGVHVKDRNNDSPLMCAINGEQKETIRALRTCGAHLQMGPLELGEKLCSFARLGDRKKLKCFKIAGRITLQFSMSLTMDHCFWTEVSVCHSSLCGLALAFSVL